MTVVVPVKDVPQALTLIVMESDTAAVMVTWTAGKKEFPVTSVTGCWVNDIVGAVILKLPLVTSANELFVLSCAVKIQLVPVALAASPPNVARPPEALTVVVPVRVQVPVVTESVMESVEDGLVVTVMVGLIVAPLTVVDG